MNHSLKNYDVIVIGSGFASHSLVRRLSNTNKKILVIEGGENTEKDEFRLLTLNDEYGHLSNNHWSSHWIRAYGGTSRRWGGTLATLDKRDFEGSKILPSWAIQKENLLAYYADAAEFLGRNKSIIYDDSRPLPDNVITYKPFSNGATLRFLDKEALKKYPNTDLWLGKNIVKFESNNRKYISGILVHDKDTGITQYHINQNQQIVLACGALGNAQILLQPNENSDISIGNESGLVGKFLMEHPYSKCSDILISEDFIPQVNSSFGKSVPAFIVSDTIYKNKSLLACIISIEDFDKNRENISEQHLFFENKFRKKLIKAVGYSISEQEPQRINSVQIIGEKNWAGLFKLRIQCAFSTRDLWSIDQTARIFAEYIYNKKSGVAKIDNNGIYRNTSGCGHTMGTTRMGNAIYDSVCDRNCKVHSYTNLYLAGSSVFTTSGASNPTLTIVALSLRLADHLAKN